MVGGRAGRAGARLRRAGAQELRSSSGEERSSSENRYGAAVPIFFRFASAIAWNFTGVCVCVPACALHKCEGTKGAVRERGKITQKSLCANNGGATARGRRGTATHTHATPPSSCFPPVKTHFS